MSLHKMKISESGGGRVGWGVCEAGGFDVVDKVGVLLLLLLYSLLFLLLLLLLLNLLLFSAPPLLRPLLPQLI